MGTAMGNLGKCMNMDFNVFLAKFRNSSPRTTAAVEGHSAMMKMKQLKIVRMRSMMK